MNLRKFRTYFNSNLVNIYPKSEIDTFFFLLMENYLGLERIQVVMNDHLEIQTDKINLLNTALKRLLAEEPIQYILGHTEFYGLPFWVNKHVLIPRPETEELVAWILTEIKEKRERKKDTSLHILDIGTGSGCIPISLKKNLPNASISAIDISKDALSVAGRNALLNNVEINFIQKDILKTNNLELVYASKTKPLQNDKGGQSTFEEEITSSLTPRNDTKFDIIISNPPYVRELEKQEIKNNVLENEPHLALFVKDNNPLLFYDKIANLAKKYLTNNGALFFEINQYLGTETVDLLREKGFQNIELRKDLFGNNRMVLAYK